MTPFRSVKDSLAFTAGADIIVAAHSLGNMVVSQAMQSGGFTPTRYFMINAAVALEAYDPGSVTADQVSVMTEDSWKTRDPRFFASNWHGLFASTPADRRNELTWRNRFERLPRLFEVYQFYSPGDDVVQNPISSSSNVILDILLNWNASRGAWGHQEMIKGVNVFSSGGGSLLFERTQAGWNRNFIAYPFLPDPNDSAVLELLKTDPVFEKFLERDLTQADPIVASTKAGEPKVQYDLLARALPALSYAAAVNRLQRLPNERVFDMEALGRTEGQWPTEGHTNSDNRDHWLHSDFKNVALPYVHQMYDAMISKGTLQ